MVKKNKQNILEPTNIGSNQKIKTEHPVSKLSN